MGRGVSCGGGQSSLGYLFGNGEGEGNAPPPAQNPTDNAATTEPSKTEPSDNTTTTETNESSENPPAAEPINKVGQNAADTTTTTNDHDSTTNNYFRADGQNCGNFITNRPSTKVHAAPGGSSSLGYLFNDEKK